MSVFKEADVCGEETRAVRRKPPTKGNTMKRFLKRFQVWSSRREAALISLRFEPRELGCHRVLKAALLPLIWTFAVCTVWSQGTTVFVPGGLANAEGNSSLSDFLNTSSFRMQMVFDASQFTGLGSGPGISNSITGIAFRPDGASTYHVLYGFGGASVTLSTTPRGPDSLSPVFADNIGPDAVTIYSGAGSFGGGYVPGASPQPFGQTFPALTPFYYYPERGNLLVDIRGVDGQVLFPGSLDAQEVMGDSVSRVFAVGNLSSTGVLGTIGLVTRFNVAVIPEPSALLLAGIGLLLVTHLRRR